jgi:hypothetical protein
VPSYAVPSPFTLNQTRPSVVSKRMVLDQTRACVCSYSPVGRIPAGPSCASTQLRADSMNALLVHSATGSWAPSERILGP